MEFIRRACEEKLERGASSKEDEIREIILRILEEKGIPYILKTCDEKLERGLSLREDEIRKIILSILEEKGVAFTK